MNPGAAPPPAPTRATLALSVTGVAWTALAVIDPALGLPGWPGLVLALLAWWRARRGAGASRMPAWAAMVAGVWALQAAVTPNLGADSRSYFAYLPSAVFDRDLDFADEFREWGFGELPPQSWLVRGVHPVGPALVWSPFYVGAHVYVRLGAALGREAYAPDGLSAPYLRAATLGTGLAVAVGMALLVAWLRQRTDRGTAVLAVVGVTASSTIPYYVLMQPAMAHGVVFGVASSLLWALGRAEQRPTGRRWMAVGALFGLLVLCRWQALVALALIAPFAVRDLGRRRLSPGALAGAAGAALAAFSPQLLAWKLQHGAWVTQPQGPGYVDWSSPHFLDVFASADRGLLPWTPVAALGLAGLVALLLRWPALAAGSLATVLLTAWVNGGVRDWTGNDAFGARRFDLVVPLLALGLVPVIEWLQRAVMRRPVLLPAALLTVLAAWNAGLMRLHARGEFAEAAPLERVAARQAHQLRRAAESLLGALAGERGRALAYEVFVGEYLYENVGPGGTIDLGRDDARWLGEGWSPPRWREGSPRFRWALYPQACLVLPLRVQSDLPGTLTARAPRRLEGQTFDVLLNGARVGAGRLDPEWAEAPFTLPERALRRGENHLCFRFARGTGEEGHQVGAQVARVQLP